MGTTTTNYALYKPGLYEIGSTWWSLINASTDDVDSQMKTNADGVATNVINIATNTSGIATNVTAIGLNTTHRGSDGKNHADVVTNTSGIATNVTAIGLNTTHRGSNGSDHSYLDQAVTIAATPTFGGITVTNAITEFSTDGTMGGNSNGALPTEQAVKTYADSVAFTQSFSGTFGGNESEGAISLSGATDVTDEDDEDATGRANWIECTSYNDNGETLTVDGGFLYLLCTGTVTISGTITADGQGAEGGVEATSSPNNGRLGMRADGWGNPSSAGQGLDNTATYFALAAVNGRNGPPEFAISGSGGGGGAGAVSYAGGGGAGGGNFGGKGGTAATDDDQAGLATTDAKKIKLTGGLGDGTNNLTHFNFPQILFYYGAGGGSGCSNPTSNGGGAGAGGGVIYIECDIFNSTGTITADGEAGSNGTGGSAGGGGGGGGGVVIVRCNTLISAGTVTVTAGAGATGFGGGKNSSAGAVGYKSVAAI